MAYVPSYRHTAPSSRSRVWKIVLVCVLLAAVFGGSVYAFRRMAATKVVESEQEAAAESGALPAKGMVIVPAALTFSDVEGGGGRGTAAREGKDNREHIAIHAALPSIDRASVSYTAWLVSRLPFDYVAMGELTTDESGAFVLDWNGEEGKEYATYRQILITRQAKTQNADPGVHVVEGEFIP